MVVQVYDLHSYVLQNVMEPLVKRELWTNKATWTGWAKCAAVCLVFDITDLAALRVFGLMVGL